ncbi:hypothetical protein DFJ77DRAFT_71558 [Powellomyces hirtus]|nr:hypothetical protein DFJ77DRAFT_71558 [Powellomyces hirtus]
METFDNLSSWIDASQAGGSAKNFGLVQNRVHFAVDPNSSHRVKLEHTERIRGSGRHQWRIFTPVRRPGDITSIGAFLYADDYHELDFEIGYGAEDVRTRLAAEQDQLVVYMTSQATDGVSWSSLDGSQILITGDAWHELAMDLALNDTGTQFIVAWWIDGEMVKQSGQSWGPTDIGDGFRSMISLENLWWMGSRGGNEQPPGSAQRPCSPDRSPNVACFDAYSYSPAADSSGNYDDLLFQNSPTLRRF